MASEKIASEKIASDNVLSGCFPVDDDGDEEKQENKSQNGNKSVMVLWDFDWSLVNGNSDFYVMTKLWGEKEYKSKIYRQLRKDATAAGVTVFTDVMDQYCWPKLFNTHKLNKESFTKLICDIPIFPSNLHVIKTLGNDKYKAITEQYVVSDANSLLIETILQHHDIYPEIIPSDKIYTHPGWFDEESGSIRCKRYHTAEEPHGCPLNDSPQICKGKILTEEIMKKYQKDPKNLIRIYIGDGSGDYCPILRFGANDFAFCRTGKSLERRINQTKELKCTVLKWKDGKELLECFKQALPFVEF
eukprot:426513_1